MVNTLMQAKSSATLHHSQGVQSGSGGSSKGTGGGHGVSHDGSQGRGDTWDLQPSSAAGVTVGVSGPPQEQPSRSGRGRGGGRGRNGAQSRARGWGRGGHSAHPTPHALAHGQITPPPGLAPAGVIGGPSGPPQQQPNPSGRGRGGSSGDQSRGRGRGRGGHSAHPTQQPLTKSHIAPPPGLAAVRNTSVRGMLSHL